MLETFRSFIMLETLVLSCWRLSVPVYGHVVATLIITESHNQSHYPGLRNKGLSIMA